MQIMPQMIDESCHVRSFSRFLRHPRIAQTPTSSEKKPKNKSNVYGTNLFIKSSHLPCNPTHSLAPHIKHCIQNYNPRSQPRIDDSSFNVIFLGTGAGGRPNTIRSPSATALRLGGQAFLFDAGEGTQRQIVFSELSSLEITKVFITHLHADHINGLLGILFQFQIAATSSEQDPNRRKSKRNQPKRVLEIYGPSGVYNFIAMNIALTCSKFHVNIIVYELIGGKEDARIRGKTFRFDKEKEEDDASELYTRRRSGMNNIFQNRYPEISNRRLQRRTIEKGADSKWTIETHECSSQDIWEQSLRKGKKVTPTKDSYKRTLQYSIQAAELTHVRGVQTFGYVIQEPKPEIRIDVEKAQALGLKPSPKYKTLKKGFPVENDDGSRQIYPDEVVLEDTVKARKFALLGDNCGASKIMLDLCQDVDLIVHEATMVENDEAEAVQRGHSTAKMAGKIAKDVNAKVLLLNHISSGNDNIDELVDSAVKSSGGVTEVVAAYDFMEIHVPRRGFGG